LTVKVAAGMQTILAVSIAVRFLMFVCELFEAPGGGFAVPGQVFVPVVAILFSPALAMPWLSAHRMWKGKESGWILGFGSCIVCALAFLILDKLMIAIPALCLIVSLMPAVREFYTDADDDSE